MKLKDKILTFIPIFALLFMLSSSVSIAASINIDASFDDWDSVKKESLTLDNFSSTALVWEGNTVYLYAKEASGKNSSISSGAQFGFVTDTGEKISFVTSQNSYIWQEPTRDITIRNQNYSPISGTEGKGQYLNDNSYQWEISFPASFFGKNVKSLSLTDASWNVLIDDVKSEIAPEPTDTPKPTQTPTKEPQATKEPVVTGDPLPSGNIIIDGFYDDWKNLDQKDAFTWMSNNKLCSHVGGIYMDDEYVYVHVKLHQYYTSQIPLTAMVLTINGEKTMMFQANYMNGDGSINWDQSIYNLPVGISNLGLFSNEGSHPYLGNIAVTIAPKELKKDENGTPMKDPVDELEFCVDLDTISKLVGIPVESIKSISFSNSNLGADSITTSGTPTGAYLGILICLAFVGLVFLIRKKHSKSEV